jgi:hypothetical protein
LACLLANLITKMTPETVFISTDRRLHYLRTYGGLKEAEEVEDNDSDSYSRNSTESSICSGSVSSASSINNSDGEEDEGEEDGIRNPAPSLLTSITSEVMQFKMKHGRVFANYGKYGNWSPWLG